MQCDYKNLKNKIYASSLKKTVKSRSNLYNPSLNLNKYDEVNFGSTNSIAPQNNLNKNNPQQDLITTLVKKTLNIISILSDTKPNKDDIKNPKKQVSDDIVESMIKSLDNIPQDQYQRIEFLKNFFQTNLITGIQTPLKQGSSEEECILKTVFQLVNKDDYYLKTILEHSLKMSSALDIALPYNYNLNEKINIYEIIQKRNMYSLIEKRREAVDNDVFAPLDIAKLAVLSDKEYETVERLIKQVYINNKYVSSETVLNFSFVTDKNTIDYMLDNDLFNPEKIQNFGCDKNFFTSNSILQFFQGLPVDTVKKMNERNLLKEFSERKDLNTFGIALRLAIDLTDEEWANLQKRNIFSLKTSKGGYFNFKEIVDFSKLSDEEYSRIKSRDLINQVGDMIQNIRSLAMLNDESWQKIQKRGIDVSKINFNWNFDLEKLLSLSDEEWQTAQQRGLTFQDSNDYELLELSEDNWKNIEKRKLNEKKGFGDLKYDVISQIRLSKLSDEEYETACKRGLIKEAIKFGTQSFSEENLMLAKCSDEEYSLYFKRGIDKYEASVKIKKDLLKMTDKQYKRATQEIIPLVKRFDKYNNLWGDEDNSIMSDHYKLAFLDDEEYEKARQFIGVRCLAYGQFSYEEIMDIIQSEPEKIEKLKTIISISAEKSGKHFCKSTILKLAEYSSDIFDKFIEVQDYLDEKQIENYVLNGVIEDVLNSDITEEDKKLIRKINYSDLSSETQDNLVNGIIGLFEEDYSQMNLREKMTRIKSLKEIKESGILNEDESEYLNLNSRIAALQESVQHVISTDKTSKEDVVNMMQNVFANNNSKLDDLFKTTDFNIYGKNGLPLSYPRSQFINDLSDILKELSDIEQDEILKKLDITLVKNNEKIIGYDGIINLEKLSKDGIEGRVLDIATRFIKENSINTGKKELDKMLNSLIKGMPEFINIIGKQQHETHDFSLDIHILNVLKYAIKNSEYKNLTNEEKTCLKFSCILHDIAKAEKEIDTGHANLSALYARDILNKENIKMPYFMKNRIYELIDNHHWLAQYAARQKNAKEIAVLFRRDGDFKIARIMAKADLKGVSEDNSFYENHREALSENKQLPIESAIKTMNRNGQMFLTSKIIDVSKIPQVKYHGETYKVINLSELENKTDLSRFGFEKGTTPDNLRLFIHTVAERDISNLENVYYLSDPSNQGFLCVSYVSVKNHPTYYRNKFGVSLVSENVNIANAESHNQVSGQNKNLSHFVEILTDENPISSCRTLIPDYIKRTLGISNSEYAELYSKIQNFMYASQFDEIDSIKIGDKTFSSEQIKKVILEADELMIKRSDDNRHNEANLYEPKINAVVANVDSISRVPQSLLDFAKKHDLPILILGE